MTSSNQPYLAHGRSAPARWAVVLAFFTVYSTWSTTYLAIQEGVKVFPPFLFAGSRLASAGLCLWLVLRFRGEKLQLSWSAAGRNFVIGLFLFLGGNGLITVAQKTVPSGVAAILVATTPLWFALLEMAWPGGERLRLLGWLGLLIGLGGVLLKFIPQSSSAPTPLATPMWTGSLLVLTSAFCWSVGSLFVRHWPKQLPPFASAAYQMLFGGLALTFTGLCLGETAALNPATWTWGACYSFVHLLVFGSLLGFVAYNWLLTHVSSTLVGTYAYVNPVLAVLIGWQFAGETMTAWLVLSMAVILVGVALVKSGAKRTTQVLTHSQVVPEESGNSEVEEPVPVRALPLPNPVGSSR